MLENAMTLPFTLPDWVPWWVPIVLIVPALLYVLAFLFMPFSVLGVKTRLEIIEAALDDVRRDIRELSVRLPAGRQEIDFEDVYAAMPLPQRREPSGTNRPPVPPSLNDIYTDAAPIERPAPPPNMRPIRKAEPQVIRPVRSEPRLTPRR
jgi:hypothetical protein